MHEQFPFIPKERLTFEVVYSEYKTERGLMNHLAAVNEDFKRIIEQPDVKRISISVEWRKSSMWGLNPHLTGRVQLQNEEWEYDKDITCGGCGYDKLSSVMAEFLNNHLKGMLYRRRNFRTRKPPYGVTFEKGWLPHFDGGVGANCTISVLCWLGFKVTSESHGRTWDTYDLEMKHNNKKK